MIRKSKHLKEIRKILGKNKEMYLHGSRRMAEQINVTSLLPSDTDYDYAVQWHPTTIGLDAYCAKFGWRYLGDKAYKGKNNTVVVEKMLDGDKVQVQFKLNLEVYKEVFESLNPSYYFDKFYKKNRDEYKAWLEATTLTVAEAMKVDLTAYPDGPLKGYVWPFDTTTVS